MVEGEKTEGSRSVWPIMAAGLSVTALLMIGSGVASMVALRGASIRDRVFYGCEFGAGVFTALLALGAIVLLTAESHRAQSSRWSHRTLANARLVAGIVIAAALYSVWFIVTMHAHASAAGATVGSGIEGWAGRIAEMLPAGGSAILGVLILVGARQLSNEPESGVNGTDA